MAKKTYTLASPEGVEWYQPQKLAAGDTTPAEVGDEIEADLPAEQATALVAAGWLEEPDTKKTKGGNK
jgi:hypothetical protein